MTIEGEPSNQWLDIPTENKRSISDQEREISGLDVMLEGVLGIRGSEEYCFAIYRSFHAAKEELIRRGKHVESTSIDSVFYPLAFGALRVGEGKIRDQGFVAAIGIFRPSFVEEDLYDKSRELLIDTANKHLNELHFPTIVPFVSIAEQIAEREIPLAWREAIQAVDLQSL